MKRTQIIGFGIIYYGNYSSEEIRLGILHYEDCMRKSEVNYINYGKDLELLLVHYHISTPNNLWDFNSILEKKQVRNYSPKEKAISVIIPVILEDFLKLSPQERKQKFANDAMYAVRLVRERLEKKKLDIDFDTLESDLEKCNKEYLSE